MSLIDVAAINSRTDLSRYSDSELLAAWKCSHPNDDGRPYIYVELDRRGVRVPSAPETFSI
jgi:hypothetical protein